ncbi:MAG: ribonuclease R [Succinivibrio sp.]|nr:ribonuclease R [Succinivibrio sp.]
MDKNMVMGTKQERIKALLALPQAPKGPVGSDFKTALYLVSAMYNLDFSQPKNLAICANLLGSVGFKGSLKAVRLEDYQKELQVLCEDGALKRLGSSQVYGASGEVRTFSATVRAAIDQTILLMDREKHYYFYVDTPEGEECLLHSSLMILPKDEVEVMMVPKNNGKPLAYVSHLLKKRMCILGRVAHVGGRQRFATLMPDEPNLQSVQFNFLSKEDLGVARAGDVVITEIVSRTGSSCTVKTREVVKNLGNLNSIIIRAVLTHDLPSAWPKNLLKSLSRVPSEVSDAELAGRTDLRQLPLVTIDGADARDFDDAVYCTREGANWRLYVAIADVSYYVKLGTLLDKEAQQRCNSYYFPNYVIPMLPEQLSNGICSLNPNVDRLCMVCEMVITKKGLLDSYKFYPAVMNSHARLTYDEAWTMISKGSCTIPEHEGCIQDVQELNRLYQALNEARIRRGGISIESKEIYFKFDENLEICGIEPLVRNDAHKLIEECMVIANVAAATFVLEHKYETLFRVHAKPTEKKLAALSGQLSRFGLSLGTRDTPTPHDYAKFYEQVQKRQDSEVLGELLLRSMSKAEYSPVNIGHFGLSLEKYAHFTSPIRRYPDLQLHRVIKAILEHESKNHKPEWGKIGAHTYEKSELLILGARCNEREIAADEAEHEVDFALCCEYLKNFIGEVLDGTVTACTNYGLFVRLDDFMVDGLIFVGNFPDYMDYDPFTQTLVSGRGKVYGVGMKLKVKIAGIQPEERKIDLVLAQTAVRAPKPEKHPAKAQGKVQDKEALFERISDISRLKEVSAADEVKRHRSSEDLSSDLMVSHFYSNPLAMPHSAALELGSPKAKPTAEEQAERPKRKARKSSRKKR